MKLIGFFLVLFLAIVQADCCCQETRGVLQTRWAEEVTPRAVWQEYPRPQFVRQRWLNLNGVWDYAVTEKDADPPVSYEGEILVPFPVESTLSGVKRKISADECLWYRKTVYLPASWKGSRLLLHFEASDWETEVWVNGRQLGVHRGGYSPFSFEVTEHLDPALENELVVRVWDPTDTGYQPVGKQTRKPGGIFYSSSTGIWQTVWIEPVGQSFINSFRADFDRDRESITITCYGTDLLHDDLVRVKVLLSENDIISAEGLVVKALHLQIPNPRLWSPERPVLYEGTLELVRDGHTIDTVEVCFGLRDVAVAKDADGIFRIRLNGEFVFQNGVLDQGFWPDGLYTPPSEEAMVHDLEMVKAMGFNMLRKHVKVENRRFYHWCDKLGILVWQDMPNGDQRIGKGEPDILRSPESAAQFERELKEMISTLYNNPSVVMWVLFNEGWGQYETERITTLAKGYDSTRLINAASGWNDRGTGDILDIHHYPDPELPPADERRALVLGEFGGLGLRVAGHLWEETNWGYISLQTPDQLMDMYEQYYCKVFGMRDEGLSGCVYTQLTDVETETNGLITYDRRVLKADTAWYKGVNTDCFVPAPRILPTGTFCAPGDTISIVYNGEGETRFTLNGSLPGKCASLYSDPIVFFEEITVSAVVFEEEKRSRTVLAKYRQAEISRPAYTSPYSDKYIAGGDFALFDGIQGTLDFRDGKWQGIKKNDFEITFWFLQPKVAEAMEIGFLEATGNGIFPPLSVALYFSEDGDIFYKVAEKEFIQPEGYRENTVHMIDLTFKPQPVRYVRIVAKNPEFCPDWHRGRVRESWIFADEVVFR